MAARAAAPADPQLPTLTVSNRSVGSSTPVASAGLPAWVGDPIAPAVILLLAAVPPTQGPGFRASPMRCPQ